MTSPASENPPADAERLSTSLSPRPRWTNWLVFLLVLACFWFGYTRHLEWPFYLHPDERGKARQVIEKEYNFNHPMLMLVSAERAVKVLRESVDFQRNFQSVTEVGRAMVAFWLAAGVAALCTLAWRWHGWIGLVILLLLLAADGHSYKTAQHFKEDGVLMGTLGLFLLALDSFWRRIGGQIYHGKALNRQLILLGLSVGLVAASKYVGFLLWPVAFVAVVWIAPSPQKLASLLWLVLFATLGFLIPNYQMVLDFGGMKGGLAYEFQSLTHGHDGVRAKEETVINTQAIDALSRAYLWPWFWLTCLLVPVIFYFQGHQRAKKRAEQNSALLITLCIFAFSVLLLSALSLTPKFTHRYLTPIIWLAMASLGFGAAALIREGLPLSSKFQKSKLQLKRISSLLAGIALSVGLVCTQWLGWKTNFFSSFAWSELYELGLQEKQELVEAVSLLPEDSVVLMTHQPLLPAQNKRFFKDIPSPVKQTILWDKKVAKDSSLRKLQEHQPTHVLFQVSIPERFEGREVQGDPKAVKEFYEQRFFWRNLLSNSTRLDSRPHIRDRPVLTFGWDLRELKPATERVIQSPPAQQPE